MCADDFNQNVHGIILYMEGRFALKRTEAIKMATFTNRAILSYNGGIVNSNVVSGEILGRITVSKTAIGDGYSVGEPVTYIVSIINTGETVLNGITLTDDLGAYQLDGQTVVPLDYVDGSAVYYVGGIGQGSPAVEAGPPLVISGISLPAGGNALIVYQAVPNGFASPAADGNITNNVTADADGLCTPAEASNDLAVRTGAELDINKAIEPAVVVENGTLTYTLTVINCGNNDAVATDDVVITDVFDPVLTDITVRYNGVIWTEGVNYTYDEQTGEFATLPGQVTVPAATATRDPETGLWSTEPGVSVITVSGTLACQ